MTEDLVGVKRSAFPEYKIDFQMRTLYGRSIKSYLYTRFAYSYHRVRMFFVEKKFKETIEWAEDVHKGQ